MEKRLRVQMIFAHPDDGEDCGGTAIQLARAGHTVQILSMTNGQSGHYDLMGQKLAAIRYQEAQLSAKRLGVHSYIVLDNNDGYLTADIHTREALMRSMREFAPDIVITSRAYEYHPDVRAAAQLVHDCASLIRVPNFLPLTPIPAAAPIVFYKQDAVMKPIPLEADIVVDIDAVAEVKLKAYDAHATQMYGFRPWWLGEDLSEVPTNPKERMEYLRGLFYPQWAKVAERFRAELIEKYGVERGCRIKYAEAFEAAECGAPHDRQAEQKLFDFAPC